MSSPSATSTSSSRPSYAHLLPYTIPNCIALQIIGGDNETPLSKGDLTLQLPTITTSGRSPTTEGPARPLSPLPPSSPAAAATTTPILLAFVGKTLFPLYKDTNFGTFTNNSRQYAFDFRLSKDTKTQVRLVLPEDVSESVQDGFEEILFQSGLLLQGFRAAGDEIMRSARFGGKENAQSIKQGTQAHIDKTPGAGENPLKFTKNTHDVAESFSSGSNTVYDYAVSASNVIYSAAGTAGAGLRQGFNSINESLPASIQSKDKSSSSSSDPNDMSDMRRAINEAASGVAQGTSDIAGSLQESSSAAISHNYGDDAKKLAETTGEGLKTNAKTLGHAMHASSLTGMGASAVQGGVEDREEEERVSK